MGVEQGGVDRLALALTLLAAAAPARAQEVTLPLERYEELRAKARVEPSPEPPPAVSFALESAEIEVVAAGDAARVTQRLTLSLYGSGWLTLPLPAAGQLTSAGLAALEGRVRAEAGWSLVVRGSGRHQVRLESVLPLPDDPTATRPTRTLDLPLPEAAVVTGLLQVGPEVEQVVLVKGALARAEAVAGRHAFVGRPGARLEARLLGKAQRPERSRLPLRFSARSASLTRFARTRTDVESWVEAEVAQGELGDVRLSLPAGFEVKGVGGDAVAGWDVKEGVLVVTPLAPLTGRLALHVMLTAEPRAELLAPVLRVEGAQSARYAVAVSAPGGLPEVAQVASGRAPHPEERAALPEALAVATAAVLIVADPARPPSWAVTWPESGQVLAAQVDRLRLDVLAGEAGRASYRCWVQVRTSGLLQLDVRLPAGFELLAVERDGTAVVPGRLADGVAVPLRSGTEAQVVYLEGLVPLALPPQEGRVELPVPGLSAPIGRVELRALLPRGRSYAFEDPTKADAVAAPPVPARRDDTRDSGLQRALALSNARPVQAREPHPVPQSHVALEAAWSALSATPLPLVLRAKPERARTEWF